MSRKGDCKKPETFHAGRLRNSDDLQSRMFSPENCDTAFRHSKVPGKEIDESDVRLSFHRPFLHADQERTIIEPSYLICLR